MEESVVTRLIEQPPLVASRPGVDNAWASVDASIAEVLSAEPHLRVR